MDCYIAIEERDNCGTDLLNMCAMRLEVHQVLLGQHLFHDSVDMSVEVTAITIARLYCMLI